MRFVRTVTAAAAVVALSGVAFAGQTAPAKPVAKSVAAKPAKATMISTSGTVSKFDAASSTLTLTTAKGDVSFVVDSTASVMAGGKKVMAVDLSSHTGQKATVRYTDANGQKTAQSVRITAPVAKTASVKKTSTAKKS